MTASYIYIGTVGEEKYMYICIHFPSPTVPAYSSMKLKIAFPSTTLYSSAFECRWVCF